MEPKVSGFVRDVQGIISLGNSSVTFKSQRQRLLRNFRIMNFIQLCPGFLRVRMNFFKTFFRNDLVAYRPAFFSKYRKSMKTEAARTSCLSLFERFGSLNSTMKLSLSVKASEKIPVHFF